MLPREAMSASFLPASLWAVCWLALVSGVSAQDAPPVQAHLDATEAWMGQKVVIVVELFSPTRFQGSPGFQIPPVAGALVMQSAESPVLSSQSIDGHEYFVQRHEVLVFPQREGAVRIPPIPIRFGITGDPPADREGATPEFSFTSKRPPGTENLDSIVTTPSLKITETWNAKPTATGDGTEPTAMTGDAFLRTVVIKADDLPGMVLPTLPTDAPDGLRVYPREPLVADKNERGTLTGTRTETLSYLCAAPGRYTLPELRFPWWDPIAEILRFETLPAVSFTVMAATPATPATTGPVGDAADQNSEWHRWLVSCLLLVLLTLGPWAARHRIARAWNGWRRSEAVEFRRLLRACHDSDPTAALRAWHQWRRAQSPEQRANWDRVTATSEPLRRESIRLQAALFGNQSSETWNGTDLANTLRSARRMLRTRIRVNAAPHLAPLNPTRLDGRAIDGDSESVSSTDF